MKDHYACPDCKDTRHLDIDAVVRVRLIQNLRTGEFETDADESEDGSHEWDDTSTVRCAECGWVGTMHEAEVLVEGDGTYGDGDEDEDEDGDGDEKSEQALSPICAECRNPFTLGDVITTARDGARFHMRCWSNT